ncbi:hypothetical protein EMCRGX_G030898 [Ephydatia muelleri]
MATRTFSFSHVLTKTVRLRKGPSLQRLTRNGVTSGGDTCPPEPRDSWSNEGGPEQRERRHNSFSLAPVSPPRELQAALDNVLARHTHKTLVQDGAALANYLISRKTTSSIDRKKLEPRAPGTHSTALHHHSAHTSRCREGSIGHRTAECPPHSEILIRYGNKEAVCYAASRLQATYGVTFRVLAEIAHMVPSFKPETLLDFGSGLGTAVWAAHQLWGESIYEYLCVDTSQEMGEMARLLRLGGQTATGNTVLENESIPGVFFRQYLPVSGKVKYDMVVAAYTLGEIPTIRWRKISLASLWRKTRDFLVLVEPGTWSGYYNILEARDFLLNSPTWADPEYLQDTSDGDGTTLQGGHIFAPCPHSQKCPLADGSRVPCHFAQRVHLSFTQRNSVLRHSGFHIEKFSYLILRKGEKAKVTDNPSRLLEPVKKRTRHAIYKLCCPDGQAREVILSKSKTPDAYRAAREKRWGDLLEWSGCSSRCHSDASDSNPRT